MKAGMESEIDQLFKKSLQDTNHFLLSYDAENWNAMKTMLDKHQVHKPFDFWFALLRIFR